MMAPLRRRFSLLCIYSLLSLLMTYFIYFRDFEITRKSFLAAFDDHGRHRRDEAKSKRCRLPAATILRMRWISL